MHIEITDDGNWLTDATKTLLQRAANAAAQLEGLKGPVAVCLYIVGDDKIRALNLRTRGVDRATDVLSFPTVSYAEGRTAGGSPQRISATYDDDLRAQDLGDIVISFDHAAQQAMEYGHGIEREFCYLFVHGLFHLMGYDHMENGEKCRMRIMEERALSTCGLNRT